MTRPTAFATPIVALALCSLLWLSSLAPAQAATVTDTFPLKLTGTERCRNNPKFVETIKWKILDGKTLTLTRDVLNAGDLTDIQATIDNSDNATIDAMTLNGRAFPKNQSGSTAKLVLSGRDPGNSDRFFTLRGTATFNQAGKLTNVTGTYVYQVLSESGGVPNIDCFGSGTFGAQKPPSSGGGGGADIDVTTATPVSGNTNISGTGVTVATSFDTLNGTPVTRVQVDGTSDGNLRRVLVYFATSGGAVQAVSYFWGTANLIENVVYCPVAGCTGVSVNQTSKEIFFTNTALDNNNNPPGAPPNKFATLALGGIQYP